MHSSEMGNKSHPFASVSFKPLVGHLAVEVRVFPGKYRNNLKSAYKCVIIWRPPCTEKLQVPAGAMDSLCSSRLSEAVWATGLVGAAAFPSQVIKSLEESSLPK